MRILIASLALLLPIAAGAQSCTTSPCTAAGVSEAQFLAALPTSGSTGVFVVNIPSGSSTWTTGFSYTVPSGITSLTIQGATTVTFTGTAGQSNYTPTATDNTSITDGITGSTPLSTFIVNGSSQFFRFTGLTITSAASNANAKYGELYFGGSTYDIRLDHNHFISPADTGSMARWGGTVGVVDHNKVDLGSLANQNVMNAFQSDDTPDDNIGYGDGNFAKATPWGTNKMLYIEANYFTAGAPDDCAIGGMFVMRYNTVIDAYVSTQTHGTKSDAGAGRGCRAFEAYHNYYFASGTNTPWDSVIGSKGTTALIWGNTMPAGGFYRFFVPSTDRNINPANVNESAGQPTDWGFCGTNINGTGSTWDGNQSTALGWPCLDSIGRGQDTQALNGASTIAARLNTVTGTQAWSHQLLEPVYLFMNTVSPASGVEVSPRDQTTTADRDYYSECNTGFSDSTCASTAFNGAHGTGSGLLSARPSTCNAGPGGTYGASPTGSYGVAYWATDANSGNGELYVCTAGTAGTSGTWTAIYQPYTYPHPLISGGSLTSTSTSLGAASTSLSAGSSDLLTATVTSSSATGTVTLFDNVTSIGSCTLSSGSCTFTATGITAGSHPYSAVYGGDSTFASSTSSTVTVTASSGPTVYGISPGASYQGAVVH